jgi:hypothetical protein
MANFTVRVELHQAVRADYDVLHAAMEKTGFSRLIKGDSGKTYHLPWAEYTGSGSLTSVQVRDFARTAANTTGKENAILVTEALGWAWIGLSAK